MFWDTKLCQVCSFLRVQPTVTKKWQQTGKILLLKTFRGCTCLTGLWYSPMLMPAGITPGTSGNLVVYLHEVLVINNLVWSPPSLVHRCWLTEPFALYRAWDTPFHVSPVSERSVITNVLLGHACKICTWPIIASAAALGKSGNSNTLLQWA